MYTQIVVGFDGSDRALRAVEEAADMATAVGSALHVVSAVPKDRIHEFGEGSDARVMTDEEIAQDQLANVASKFSHLQLTTAASSGAPAKVLVEQAALVDADLIVVGNKNVQGRNRMLSSVAEAVAQKAPCAVLIAKTE